MLLVILLISPSLSQLTREDGRCGPGWPSKDGPDASCEHIPPFPTCCQSSGHCGWDCEDTPPVKSSSNNEVKARIPAAAPAQSPSYSSNGKYRDDGRCGAEFPLSDGSPAECDPNSEYWCCSNNGYCGGTQEHCYCDTCVNYRPVDLIAGGLVRSDRRCGAKFPLPNGDISQCDGNSGDHCCSINGYCGPGPEHCDSPGSVDYRGENPVAVPLLVGRVRTDRRCGSKYPLDDGEPSECDGSSVNPCCSKWGFCGPGDAHCGCPTCVDYRTKEQKTQDWIGKWRKDHRCGPEVPLPDGSGPTECDPDSERFCCSKWGFCGGSEEHCLCEECVNYG